MSSYACGPYSQTLFLGASITSFSASLGWNGDQGRLSVELVEDPCRGTKVFYDGGGNARITDQPDFFNPPKMGSPVYFKFGNFSFGGILENWEEQVDVKGGKTYSVKLIDGIEILDSCQVIINNYTGSTFGVPNLINAFGYTEQLNSTCNTSAYTSSLNPALGYTPAPGFGGSNIAEDGMSWFQIREAISVLSAIPTSFGGQLQLRNNRFYIDISELPVLDANFRFNGDSLTISECISQVCAASGMDYFTEILYFAPGSVDLGYGGIAGHLDDNVMKFIKIRTVLRNIQRTSAYNVDLTVGSPISARLNFGAITQYVGSGDGRTRSSRGLELRSDVTNSFLVGDNRQDLWQQAYTGSQDTYTDTIWPFWGRQENGYPIISSGVNDDHAFRVSTTSFGPDLIDKIATYNTDILALSPTLTNTYEMKMIELRAALTGMEEWSLYVWENKEELAEALEIDTSFAVRDVAAIAGADVKPRPDDLKDTRTAAMKRAAKQAGLNPDGEEIDFAELQKRLYDIVRSYAELAGKKFLVSLPLVCSAVDPAAPYAIKMNWEPSDGAWTDANVQLHSSATSLPPSSPVLELLRLPDGRISSFVYFNTYNADDDDGIERLIDYSSMSPDDVIPISDTECYVRANVDEILFLNPVSRTYPRAVVSLNSMVCINKAKELKERNGKTIDALLGWLTNAPRTWFDKKAGAIGDDTNKLGLHPMPILPKGAAVPLRSTNLSYGPWITSLTLGPASRTSYERDPSLSPWAFGSTQIMNYAAQVAVETRVTQQIVSEAGSFTMPGPPPNRLGEVLLAGGPEITNIDAEVSIGGVMTTVRLRTFVPNFGEIGRRRIQVLRQSGTYQQKLQRAFLNKTANKLNSTNVAGLTRPFIKSDRFDRHSSHTIIAGEYIQDYLNPSFSRVNVAMTDTRKVLPELFNNYEKKAFMELGGLFRPYATSGVINLTESGDTNRSIPAFSSIIPTATNITCLSLNPFKIREQYNGSSTGHNIEYVARGTGNLAITDLSIKKAGDYGDGVYRGIGLASPLVLVGWGFDTNGKPVPNANPGSPSTNFATDYLQKPETWKAGPLDVRWDESRGVWSAIGGSFRIARLQQNLIPGFSASGNLGTVTEVGSSFSIVYESGLTRIYDGLKNFSTASYPQYPATPSGAIVYIQKEQTSNAWFMTSASVW